MQIYMAKLGHFSVEKTCKILQSSAYLFIQKVLQKRPNAFIFHTGSHFSAAEEQKISTEFPTEKLAHFFLQINFHTGSDLKHACIFDSIK